MKKFIKSLVILGSAVALSFFTSCANDIGGNDDVSASKVSMCVSLTDDSRIIRPNLSMSEITEVFVSLAGEKNYFENTYSLTESRSFKIEHERLYVGKYQISLKCFNKEKKVIFVGSKSDILLSKKDQSISVPVTYNSTAEGTGNLYLVITDIYEKARDLEFDLPEDIGDAESVIVPVESSLNAVTAQLTNPEMTEFIQLKVSYKVSTVSLENSSGSVESKKVVSSLILENEEPVSSDIYKLVITYRNDNLDVYNVVIPAVYVQIVDDITTEAEVECLDFTDTESIFYVTGEDTPYNGSSETSRISLNKLLDRYSESDEDSSSIILKIDEEEGIPEIDAARLMNLAMYKTFYLFNDSTLLARLSCDGIDLSSVEKEASIDLVVSNSNPEEVSELNVVVKAINSINSITVKNGITLNMSASEECFLKEENKIELYIDNLENNLYKSMIHVSENADTAYVSSFIENFAELYDLDGNQLSILVKEEMYSEDIFIDFYASKNAVEYAALSTSDEVTMEIKDLETHEVLDELNVSGSYMFTEKPIEINVPSTYAAYELKNNSNSVEYFKQIENAVNANSYVSFYFRAEDGETNLQRKVEFEKAKVPEPQVLSDVENSEDSDGNYIFNVSEDPIELTYSVLCSMPGIPYTFIPVETEKNHTDDWWQTRLEELFNSDNLATYVDVANSNENFELTIPDEDSVIVYPFQEVSSERYDEICAARAIYSMDAVSSYRRVFVLAGHLTTGDIVDFRKVSAKSVVVKKSFGTDVLFYNSSKNYELVPFDEISEHIMGTDTVTNDYDDWAFDGSNNFYRLEKGDSSAGDNNYYIRKGNPQEEGDLIYSSEMDTPYRRIYIDVEKDILYVFSSDRSGKNFGLSIYNNASLITEVKDADRSLIYSTEEELCSENGIYDFVVAESKLYVMVQYLTEDYKYKLRVISFDITGDSDTLLNPTVNDDLFDSFAAYQDEYENKKYKIEFKDCIALDSYLAVVVKQFDASYKTRRGAVIAFKNYDLTSEPYIIGLSDDLWNDSENCFYGPEKIVALKPKEIVIAEAGVRNVKKDTSDDKYKYPDGTEVTVTGDIASTVENLQFNRVVSVNLEEKTLSAVNVSWDFGKSLTWDTGCNFIIEKN